MTLSVQDGPCVKDDAVITRLPDESQAAQLKMDSIINQSHVQRQSSISTKNIVKSLNSSFETMNETAKISNEKLDTKMETLTKHLAVIKDELTRLSKAQHSFPSITSSDHPIDDYCANDGDETLIANKFDEVNQQLTNLHCEVSGIKTLIEEQNEQLHFEKMIQCADCGSFSYYEGFSDEWEDSADIVCTALKWFALGHGCNIRADYTTRKSSVSEAGRKEFRIKLSTQLTDIMGQKPRFVKSDDGSYDIFYT